MKITDLEEGKIYIDSKSKEAVEFKYAGQTGLAIVCEPGDSGGGMQSSWGLDPEQLIEAPSMGPEQFIDKVFASVRSNTNGDISREDAEEEIWKAFNWYLAEHPVWRSYDGD